MPFRLDGTDIRLLTELQLRGDRSLSQIAAVGISVHFDPAHECA
jgi:hypothetical protein